MEVVAVNGLTGLIVCRASSMHSMTFILMLDWRSRCYGFSLILHSRDPAPAPVVRSELVLRFDIWCSNTVCCWMWWLFS